MRIFVYVLIYDPNLSFERFRSLTKNVSPSRAEAIQRFMFDRDKLNSLFAELVLRKALRERYGIENHSIKIGKGEYGKPFLENSPIKFSISHSNNCVAVAVSENEIGLDAEKISMWYQDISKNYFSKSEHEYIVHAKDINKAFFEVWTKKEAYLKMKGTGLSVPLSSFSVFAGEFQRHCVCTQVQEYLCSVYSECEITEALIDCTAVSENWLAEDFGNLARI